MSGTLRVESTPTGAAVFVDSLWAGRTPFEVALQPGERFVRIVYTGYAPVEETAALRAGETTLVAPTLVRLTGVVSLAGLPPGATASVDGAPIDGRTVVPTGRTRVIVAVPGQRPIEATTEVYSRAETVIEYVPRAFDRKELILGLFAPGVTQIRGGRAIAGVAALTGIAAGLGVAVAARGRENEASDRMAEAVRVYQLAESEAAAVAAWGPVEAAYGDVRSAHRGMTVALGAAATVYGISVLDALLHHVRHPMLRVSALPTPEVSFNGRGVRLVLPL